MKNIIEPAKSTPVLAETEVLVVGSGPAGLAAAISAAREGVKTMLVERYGSFGGNISQVGVDSLAWYRFEETYDVQGIGIEFEKRALEVSRSVGKPFYKSKSIDTEMFKIVADQMVQEEGIEPLLHSYAVASIMDDRTIEGSIIENKSGRQAILADRVIDATGDADIAVLSGAQFQKTPKDEMMGVTVIFSCSGVDIEKFLEYVRQQPATFGEWKENWEIQTSSEVESLFSPYLGRAFQQAREDGLIPENLTSIGGTWSRLTEAGEATGLNLVYMFGYDGTDVRDLTQGEIEGRRQTMLALEVLRNYVPGFERANLRNFSSTLGIRDTRQIVGQYLLTGEDVRNEARFADSIGLFPEFLDGYGVLTLPITGRHFQIPYRILVPRDVENLLAAGRCVSGDKIAHAALRSMMCCTVTGQAAGVAAAVSIKEGVDCSKVNIERVQEALVKQGVRIK